MANTKESVESIVRETRPMQNNDIFTKTRLVANFFGKEEIETEEDHVLHSFVHEYKGLNFIYYLWRDEKDSGFGVEINQNGELLYCTGIHRAHVYNRGEWEDKLNKLYELYNNRN